MRHHTTRRPRRAFLPCAALIAAAGLALQPGSGSIIKPAWKAKGGAFNAAETTAVTNAINQFGALTITIASAPDSVPLRDLRATTINLAKCADCLKKMLAKNRLCKETDLTGGYGAVTAADGNAACSPTADAINVRTDLFTVPEMLAAALAHEWCHTAQANAVGTPNFEIPCYQVEIQVLTQLKAGAAAGNKVAIQNRIDQMTKCAQDLQAKLAGAVVPPKTPAFGGGIHQSQTGRTYSAFSGQGGLLFMGDSTTPLFSQPLVAITRPFNLNAIDDFFGPGFDLVFVMGVNEPTNTGVIEVYEANPSLFGASLVHPPIQVPNWHPFDAKYDPDSGRLFVLDTAVSQIFTVQFDPLNFSNPPSMGPIFANTAIDPTLNLAQAIELVPGPPTTSGGPAVVTFEEDLRSVDRVGSFQNTGQTLLVDTNGDMVADNIFPGNFLSDFLVLPGYPDRIQDGAATLRVIGTAGATIAVDAVDPTTGVPIEPLGATFIPPNDRIGSVSLTRPLVQGESIRATDLSNAFDVQPVPEVVRPFCFDFTGDDLVGPTDLLTLLAGFGNPFTPTDLLGLLAQFGQPCQ